MLTWTTRSVSWGQRQQGTWVREASTRSPAPPQGSHSHPRGCRGWRERLWAPCSSRTRTLGQHSDVLHMLAPVWHSRLPLTRLGVFPHRPPAGAGCGPGREQGFLCKTLAHTQQPPSPRPGRAGAMSPCPRWHEHDSERLSPLATAAQQAGQSRVVQSVFSTHQVPERRGCVQATLPPSPSRA